MNSAAPGLIYVIGDSHIGLADGSEQRVNAWIDRLAERKPKALYLNGDLFHYLIAHRKFVTTSVTKVMSKFRELLDRGVEIHFVEGNRDFFLKGSFVEQSVTDVGMEYVIEAGKARYLLIHGDLINDRDLPYRFWRFASKNPISKLGLELIPKKTARRFVDGVEKRLAKSNFKHKSKLPIELMKSFARRRAPEGFSHIVLGHFHQKVTFDADATVVTILPPWYETGEAMAIDPASGEHDWVVV